MIFYVIGEKYITITAFRLYLHKHSELNARGSKTFDVSRHQFLFPATLFDCELAICSKLVEMHLD